MVWWIWLGKNNKLIYIKDKLLDKEMKPPYTPP